MDVYSRRIFLQHLGAAGCLAFSPLPQKEPNNSDPLLAGWKNPPPDCRPRTRWWWPGNAVSKEGIQQQLSEMKTGGIGGVEIVSSWQWYEKANIPFLSPKFFEMLQFTAERAKLLDMSVSLSFGPEGNFGGHWVPVAERSKCLAPVWLDVTGPKQFEEILPPSITIPSAFIAKNITNDRTGELATNAGQIVAVVAARFDGKKLDGDTLTDISQQVIQGRLQWQIPEGNWRIGVFRLQHTGLVVPFQNNDLPSYCIDHLNPLAVRKYTQYLGEQYSKKLGKYFNFPIDTFFIYSSNIAPLSGTILWSDALFSEFKRRNGYDLTLYLPALWQDIGANTALVRQDVSEFIHQLTKEIYYHEFMNWCEANRMRADIKPYPRELILVRDGDYSSEPKACGENYQFNTGLMKTVVAGENMPPRNIVSVEAYTSLPQGRYGTTLETLKRTTDSYFCDGITQINNQGWTYSEEPEVSPERDVPWGTRIQPWSPWFKHYRGLSDYISRCSWLLRQGHRVADVLIYIPQTTTWSAQIFDDPLPCQSFYSDLFQTLKTNGYNYELVNDDLLQNHASVKENGSLKINQDSYHLLLLPKVTALPLATLRQFELFALNGGIVIALGHLPNQVTSLKESRSLNDSQFIHVINKIFNRENHNVHFLPEYKIVTPAVSQPTAKDHIAVPLLNAQRRLLEILHAAISPDISLTGSKPDKSLAFLHRRFEDKDIYFLTNLQSEKISTSVSFRVTGKSVDWWDAMSGQVRPLPEYRTTMSRTEVPLTLYPGESIFLVFRSSVSRPHITRTDLAVVESVRSSGIIAYADREGEHSVVIAQGMSRHTLRAWAPALPEVIFIRGEWKLTTSGIRAPRINKTLSNLTSWTEHEDLRHLAGEGVYEISFTMLPEAIPENVRWILDLGKVAETAEVTLNEKRIGVRWMQPYDFDVTRELKIGKNHLRVAVTNTLHNHIFELEEGTNIPARLKKRFQEQNKNYRLGKRALLHEVKHLPLVSGLLGPVKLVPQGIVLFKF